MIIRLFLSTALLSTVFCDGWYHTPSPYTNNNIMSGHFKYTTLP